MINYLEKYNNLPKDLRDKISAPHVMEAIRDMEKKYSVNLAGVVMRIVVKELKVNELLNFFVYNIGISAEKAEGVIEELKEKVFSEVSNYLDYINKEEEEELEKKDDLSDVPELSVKTKTDGIKIEQNSQKADFYFSIEDEDEVRKQSRDFSDLDKREQVAKQVEDKIADIMGKINVIFSSEEMSGRLKMVLKTYLRGVRDQVDTKLALERVVGKGGLGLDEEISDDILKIVNVINEDEKAHPGRVIKPKSFSLTEDKQVAETKDFMGSSLGGDADYDFSKLGDDVKKEKEDSLKLDNKSLVQIDVDNKVEDNVKTENKEEDKIIKPETENKEEAKVSEPKIENKKEEKEEKKENKKEESVKDIEIENKTEQVKEKEKELVLDLSKAMEVIEKKEKDIKSDKHIDNEETDREVKDFSPGMIAKARNKQPAKIDTQKVSLKQFGDMAGKVKMEDIKKVSKLGGTLEEVGSMSLVDFRRISKDTKITIAKIMGMFKLLEEDSFSKRLAGIKAWRKSPVNRLYLSLGQESIVKQKDIKEVIEIRKKDKKEYLSQEEFDAIMELNTKLRY